MPEKSTDYKGVNITVRTPEGAPTPLVAQPAEVSGLYVDGQFVPTTASAATGRHWTYLLPYQEFESLMSLGEAVVDYVHGHAAEKRDGR